MEKQTFFEFFNPGSSEAEANKAMQEISQDSLNEIMFHLREIVKLSKWVNMEDIHA